MVSKGHIRVPIMHSCCLRNQRRAFNIYDLDAFRFNKVTVIFTNRRGILSFYSFF